MALYTAHSQDARADVIGHCNRPTGHITTTRSLRVEALKPSLLWRATDDIAGSIALRLIWLTIAGSIALRINEVN
jgi:hypothetical protein